MESHTVAVLLTVLVLLLTRDGGAYFELKRLTSERQRPLLVGGLEIFVKLSFYVFFN